MFSQFKLNQAVMVWEGGRYYPGKITWVGDDGFGADAKHIGYRSFPPDGDDGVCHVIPVYPHMTVVSFAGVNTVRVDNEWVTNLTVEGKRLILKELPAGEEITVLYHP